MKNVVIYDGKSSMGTMFIYEKIINGEIVKENAKSIRVHLTHCKYTTNGKLTRECDMNETATFAFWKVINKECGKNKGKDVALYKNKDYGIIEIVVK